MLRLRPWFAAALLCAASAVAQELPSNEALLAAGARIGEIRILPGDVFDTTLPGENRALYRAANRLHIESREGTVRRALLFKEGELYQPRLLAESERLLRERRQFQDAWIRIIGVRDGVVDIEVRTQDVWSLQPEISFGRSGGQNESTIGIAETNLLGTGYEIAVSRVDKVDRNGTEFSLRTPELGHNRWRGGFDIADNDDGESLRVRAERPFFAFDTRWAILTEVEDRNFEYFRYARGEETDGFAVDSKRGEFALGRLINLHKATPIRTKALRWWVGVGLDRAHFDLLPETDPSLAIVLRDRDLFYPFLGLEFSEDKFVRTENRDLMGRTEDLQIGWYANLRLGASGRVGNADEEAWLYWFNARRTYFINERASLALDVDLSGRREQGQQRDAWHRYALRYDYRWNDFTASHIDLEVAHGRKLDLDHERYFGGDNGLSGYPLRYLRSERFSRLQLEQRFYTEWYPWRLFKVGAAVFAGFGHADDAEPGEPDRMRDVGIGLRLFNTRSSLARVIHIDLASPLEGLDEDGDELDRLQIVVRTESGF